MIVRAVERTEVVQVESASATAAYRVAQETAAVVSGVVPAVSMGRAHGRAVVAVLPAWEAVAVAAVVSAVAAGVAAAAAVVVAVAAVAGGDNKL